MRPGYLQGYGEDTTRPGNFGDIQASRAHRYLDPTDTGMPDELEVGYIPEYMRYSKIFPNPASDRLTIQMETNMKRVSIFSLSGQKVYELALDQAKVDLNIDFLETGIYMIKLETDAGAKIEKLHVR